MTRSEGFTEQIGTTDEIMKPESIDRWISTMLDLMFSWDLLTVILNKIEFGLYNLKNLFKWDCK